MSASLAVPTQALSIRLSPAYRRRKRLSATLIVTGWVCALFSPPRVLEGVRADHLADAVGWVLLATGIGLRYWSILHIAGRKSKNVVDTGPYALCRNPLYVGTLLLVSSEAAFLKSAWFVACALPVLVLYVWGVVPAEERWLTAKLGPEYEEYCTRTPRWLPRFSRNCLTRVTMIDRRALISELRLLAWWSMLPLLGELTCTLRNSAVWPHLLRWF